MGATADQTPCGSGDHADAEENKPVARQEALGRGPIDRDPERQAQDALQKMNAGQASGERNGSWFINDLWRGEG